MIIPLPFTDLYECRDETLEVFASDRRGQVKYQFNNYGYRNNINYQVGESDVAVFLGSSLASGIGVQWEDSFPYLVSEKLRTSCYHYSQGCKEIDNQETLRILKQTISDGVCPTYIVIQFIDLDRRYDNITGTTVRDPDSEKNIQLFKKTFDSIAELLQNQNWCFFTCDNLSHEVPEYIKKHSRCVAWNLKYIDHCGVGDHPGNKWHKIISYGIAAKLQMCL